MRNKEHVHASSNDIKQYMAYYWHIFSEEAVNTSNVASCKFVVGSVSSFGIAFIKSLVKNLLLFFTIHIVEADVPLLKSLSNMYELKIQFYNLDNKVIHMSSGTTDDTARHRGHHLFSRSRR